MISKRIFALETLITSGFCTLIGSVITVALVMILQVVTDHEGLAAATLLTLVGPLIGMSSHVFLQVTLGGELLAALGSVTVESVPCVEARVGIEAVQGGEGILATLHLAYERLLAGVDPDVDLEGERKYYIENITLPEAQRKSIASLSCHA